MSKSHEAIKKRATSEFAMSKSHEAIKKRATSESTNHPSLRTNYPD
jgi:hypothetical protein